MRRFFLASAWLLNGSMAAAQVATPFTETVHGQILAILLICFAFGGMGGIVAHFVNNEKQAGWGRSQSDTSETGKWKKEWYQFPSMFQSGCIGIAGALGFLFFISAVGGVSSPFNDLQEYLRIISSSVIAGFGARSLLPKMAGQLEKQVAEASQKADEAIGETRSNKDQIARLEAHMKLQAARHPSASAPSRDEALRRGQELIRNGDDNSATWINIASVQRWSGQIEVAIETLNKAIERMTDGSLDNLNIGTAYYNRGCYRALVFKTSGDKACLEDSLNDLRTFLDQAADRIKETEAVLGDDDWNHLAQHSAFMAIIGKGPQVP